MHWFSIVLKYLSHHLSHQCRYLLHILTALNRQSQYLKTWARKWSADFTDLDCFTVLLHTLLFSLISILHTFYPYHSWFYIWIALTRQLVALLLAWFWYVPGKLSQLSLCQVLYVVWTSILSLFLTAFSRIGSLINAFCRLRIRQVNLLYNFVYCISVLYSFQFRPLSVYISIYRYIIICSYFDIASSYSSFLLSWLF